MKYDENTFENIFVRYNGNIDNNCFIFNPFYHSMIIVGNEMIKTKRKNNSIQTETIFFNLKCHVTMMRKNGHRHQNDFLLQE